MIMNAEDTQRMLNHIDLLERSYAEGRFEGRALKRRRQGRFEGRDRC